MSTARKRTAQLLILLLINSAAIARADDIAQGRVLYLQYCASCHGRNGEGNGPMARALTTTPPTNLRLLSDLYGNPLEEDKVARAIDGRLEVKAHGPRDMPVWGERFSGESQGSELRIEDRIAKLVAYLQSIQGGGRSASRE
jgi:mono/diheme cytochrome c family protein